MELMTLESPINIGSIRPFSVANLALVITVSVAALTTAVLVVGVVGHVAVNLMGIQMVQSST